MLTGIVNLYFTFPRNSTIRVPEGSGGSGESSSTGLSFQVNDIEAACKEVVEGGGRVFSGPSDRPGEPIRLADLADTEGNRFTLSQYVG